MDTNPIVCTCRMCGAARTLAEYLALESPRAGDRSSVPGLPGFDFLWRNCCGDTAVVPVIAGTNDVVPDDLWAQLEHAADSGPDAVEALLERLGWGR